ncbi:hypothetical protein ABES23_14525 [Peribacillus frigoritolerans]|uniref:hypothetical protein n=1 Tax=Peribacillus frigoritolerans TaxID=450367 RepID=UPI003D2A6C1F
MVNSLQESIRRKLSAGKEEGANKQVSLIVNERILQKADAIVEQFKVLTDGNGDLPSSRNQLIEEAIEEYVNAASDVLLNDHLINIEEIINNEDDDDDDEVTASSEEWDLYFCPAKNKGFEDVFLGKDQWYSVRIASWRIPKIKYIACYRGTPYSAITHYAKVKEIKPYKDSGKYIIYFDGEAIPLENPVVLGKSNVMDVRKTRYTSLEKLKSAAEISEVWLD